MLQLEQYIATQGIPEHHSLPKMIELGPSCSMLPKFLFKIHCCCPRAAVDELELNQEDHAHTPPYISWMVSLVTS